MTRSERLLPAEAALEDKGIAWLEQRYAEADAASVAAARSHRRALAALAGAGTALTLAFLLYDEAEALWMIWLVGALLTCQWLIARAARTGHWHQLYLEQRVLAECLRVQAYLRYAGRTDRVRDLAPWVIRHDLAPLVDSIDSPQLEMPPAVAHDVRDTWARAQYDYHMRAAETSRRRMRRAEVVQRVCVAASVALYAATLVFELLCGGLVGPAAVAVANVGLWRAGLKIALGTASAAALFISDFYGKLALSRVGADHERMAALFKAALDGMPLEELAREELVENAMWYSYQQDNAPEIVL